MRTKLLKAISLILILAVFAGCSTKLAVPAIELNTNYFDLGDIDPGAGLRSETFAIKNTGASVLQITSVSTSCGCTDAKVDSNEISPGGQTELTVTYDPSVHPDLTGKITRVVYVKSNDPLNEEVELELTGNVLPRSDASE